MKRHGEAASAHAITVEKKRKRIQELIEKYGYKLHDIFNIDETGLFYAYTPIFFFTFWISCWLQHVGWHPIEACQIINNLESKEKKHMPSLQMLMGLRSSGLSLLEKQHGHKLSTRRQGNNLDSMTKTMQRHGWQLTFIRTGFSNGIENFKKKDANSSASGQFLQPYHSWQSSEHLSWEFWAKSHCSHPTQRPRDHLLLQSSLSCQIHPTSSWSLWWRHNTHRNLWHKSASGNAPCRSCLAWSQHHNNLKLLA